jgi:Flp pilus assembly protein protease CpaA
MRHFSVFLLWFGLDAVVYLGLVVGILGGLLLVGNKVSG